MKETELKNHKDTSINHASNKESAPEAGLRHFLKKTKAIWIPLLIVIILLIVGLFLNLDSSGSDPFSYDIF